MYRLSSLKGLAFIGFAAITLALGSCAKEDNAYFDARMKAEQVQPSLSQTSSQMEAMMGRAPMKGSQSIAQIAIDNGFSELVAALAYVDAAEGTKLVDLFLNGTDQYTVFAPTNAAFEDLYAAFGVNEVTELPSGTVLSVLYYHVVEGRRAANSVVPRRGVRTMDTLLGATFDVKPNGEIEAIGNTAKIVGPDISASNGIIHVIDAVILPI